MSARPNQSWPNQSWPNQSVNPDRSASHFIDADIAGSPKSGTIIRPLRFQVILTGGQPLRFQLVLIRSMLES